MNFESADMKYLIIIIPALLILFMSHFGFRMLFEEISDRIFYWKVVRRGVPPGFHLFRSDDGRFKCVNGFEQTCDYEKKAEALLAAWNMHKADCERVKSLARVWEEIS